MIYNIISDTTFLNYLLNMLQNLVSVSELEEIREYAPKPRDFDAEEIVQVIFGPGSR